MENRLNKAYSSIYLFQWLSMHFVKVKIVQIRSFFWSEYRKIQTRENTVFRQFWRILTMLNHSKWSLYNPIVCMQCWLFFLQYYVTKYMIWKSMNRKKFWRDIHFCISCDYDNSCIYTKTGRKTNGDVEIILIIFLINLV